MPTTTGARSIRHRQLRKELTHCQDPFALLADMALRNEELTEEINRLKSQSEVRRKVPCTCR